MLKFHKYEGAGNDFILIDNLNGKVSLQPEKIKHMCDRHLGIGADGVILLESSDKADCFMNYYNSNGSLAEMCGNGVRCTAKFYLKQTKQSKVLPYSVDYTEVSIDTRAGIKNIKINKDDTYSVNMGRAVFTHPDFPSDKEFNGLVLENLPLHFVSMGNPHAVAIVDHLDEYELSMLGPKIENNKNFPNKINLELVEKINQITYKVKVWERGCGKTLACGTGACAVYSILKMKDEKIANLILEFPGGLLSLSQNSQGEIILTGPAKFVFEGKIK